MKRSFFYLILLSLYCFFSCEKTPAETEVNYNQLYQTSTIKALLEGHYDGQVTFAELAREGDLGLGTFNALDGIFYQVKANGKVDTVSMDMKTPFAMMTHFATDTTVILNGDVNYVNFRELIDSVLPGTNLFYAFKIEGEFRELKIRSVPRQTPPYPPLAEVASDQTMIGLTRTTGTMVGFRSPGYAEDLTVPGYHLHFISDDRQHGGHVLYFEGLNAQMYINYLTDLHIALPTDSVFTGLNLEKDQREELERVESLND